MTMILSLTGAKFNQTKTLRGSTAAALAISLFSLFSIENHGFASPPPDYSNENTDPTANINWILGPGPASVPSNTVLTSISSVPVHLHENKGEFENQAFLTQAFLIEDNRSGVIRLAKISGSDVHLLFNLDIQTSSIASQSSCFNRLGTPVSGQLFSFLRGRELRKILQLSRTERRLAKYTLQNGHLFRHIQMKALMSEDRTLEVGIDRDYNFLRIRESDFQPAFNHEQTRSITLSGSSASKINFNHPAMIRLITTSHNSVELNLDYVFIYRSADGQFDLESWVTKGLPHLKRLSWTNSPDVDFKTISNQLPEIEELNFSGTEVQFSLFQNPDIYDRDDTDPHGLFPNLRRLDLSAQPANLNFPLDSHSLADLNRLEYLNLSGRNMGALSESLSFLVTLPRLQELRLAHTNLLDSHVDAIAKLLKVKNANLNILDLSGNPRLSKETLIELSKIRPSLLIQSDFGSIQDGEAKVAVVNSAILPE